MILMMIILTVVVVMIMEKMNMVEKELLPEFSSFGPQLACSPGIWRFTIDLLKKYFCHNFNTFPSFIGNTQLQGTVNVKLRIEACKLVQFAFCWQACSQGSQAIWRLTIDRVRFLSCLAIFIIIILLYWKMATIYFQFKNCTK